MEFLSQIWLGLAAVATALLFAWWSWQRGKAMAPHLFEGPPTGVLTVDENGVGWSDAKPGSRRLRWDEIEDVRIVTTSGGPFADDVVWVITGGEPTCTWSVPSGVPGTDLFLATAPRHLPGFDHEAVIAAMGSFEDAVFPVWSAAPA